MASWGKSLLLVQHVRRSARYEVMETTPWGEGSSSGSTGRLAPPAAPPNPRGFAISGFLCESDRSRVLVLDAASSKRCQPSLACCRRLLSFLRQIVGTIPARWTTQATIHFRGETAAPHYGMPCGRVGLASGDGSLVNYDFDLNGLFILSYLPMLLLRGRGPEQLLR